MSEWQSELKRQQKIEAAISIPGSNLVNGEIHQNQQYREKDINVTLRDDKSTLNGMKKKKGIRYLFFAFERNYATLLTPFLHS